MISQRVRRAVSAAAETVMRFAAKAINKAANSVPQSRILLLGAFAAVLAVAALPILFRAGKPPEAATSTLKCYDRAGDDEPCLTRASASPARADGRTIAAHQPASWITTALYQEPIRATPAVDQPAVDQPANETAGAAAARRETRLRRRPAYTCRRHVIPCLFSALRRGVTHLASVAAANAAPARPAREHL